MLAYGFASDPEQHCAFCASAADSSQRKLFERQNNISRTLPLLTKLKVILVDCVLRLHVSLDVNADQRLAPGWLCIRSHGSTITSSSDKPEWLFFPQLNFQACVCDDRMVVCCV